MDGVRLFFFLGAQEEELVDEEEESDEGVQRDIGGTELSPCFSSKMLEKSKNEALKLLLEIMLLFWFG